MAVASACGSGVHLCDRFRPSMADGQTTRVAAVAASRQGGTAMDIVDGKELATLPSGASFTPSFRTESPKPPSVRISAA